jgi:BTB/POZ domain
MTDPGSEDSFDVKFLVGSEQRAINAHKFILAAISSVFRRMFFSDFPSENEIVITDIDANVFEIMINSIYGREIILNAENIAQVFYVTEKYELRLLRQVCRSFIVNSINSTNALAILNTYYQFNESEINEKCLSIILDDPILFFKKPEFVEASGDVIRSILKPTRINCTASVVKSALSSWMSKNGMGNDDDQEKWFDVVENHLQITKDELETKVTMNHVFRKIDHSCYSVQALETGFCLEDGMFLHGFGLVLGNARETFTVEITTTRKAQKLVNQTVQRQEQGEGQENSVSIQDVFFEKVPILNGQLKIRIVFLRPSKRPCVQYNKQDSFVSYLILSKMP